MKRLKNKKGITLVALIITVIILLILAVVTIGAVRESKIIVRAQDVASEYEKAKEREQIELALYEWNIQRVVPGNTKTFKDVITSRLQEQANVEGENNGPLDITFNKTGNQYTVYSNGDIVTQGTQKNEPMENLEVIAYEYVLVQQPYIRTKAIIPISWKISNISEEEEAVRIITEELDYYVNTDGSKPANLKELLIAGANLMPEFPGPMAKNQYDDMIKAIKEIDSEVDLSTPQKTFLYMMDKMGENYKTVQEYAAGVSEYKPKTRSLKIRKDNGAWQDITNSATWQGNDAEYLINENATYQVLLEIDGKEAISNYVEIGGVISPYLGQYVKYDANGNGSVEDETILWRVLRDDENKVELITDAVLGSVTLESLNDSNSRDSNRIKGMYNNAITLLVDECKRVTGITENIRNVGGPADDSTIPTVDFSELDTFKPLETDRFERLEGPINGIKAGNSPMDDYSQMLATATVQAYASKSYWLASRSVITRKNRVTFAVEFVSVASGGNNSPMFDVTDMASIEPTVDYGVDSCGVRPVLMLPAGILKDVTQSGTREQPIEIYINGN